MDYVQIFLYVCAQAVGYVIAPMVMTWNSDEAYKNPVWDISANTCYIKDLTHW